MKVDIGPTAEVIEKMADLMRENAIYLDRIAAKMRDRQDISYAAEAIGIVTNSMNNLRLDLLITRPLREFQREK